MSSGQCEVLGKVSIEDRSRQENCLRTGFFDEMDQSDLVQDIQAIFGCDFRSLGKVAAIDVNFAFLLSLVMDNFEGVVNTRSIKLVRTIPDEKTKD